MLAITLTSRDWREYDQLITFYTKEQGKIEAVARGVKKITAKNSAALEPLSLLEVEIIPGKGARYAGAVEIAKNYAAVRAHLDRVLIAESALAVVNTLITGQEKDERVFKLITDFLDFLNSTSPAKESLDHFVAELVGYLGFSPPQAITSHANLLRHVRYYTGLPVADWHNYQAWLA